MYDSRSIVRGRVNDITSLLDFYGNGKDSLADNCIWYHLTSA